MATCLEVDCDRAVTARGLCAKHYDFRKRHGTLPPKAPPWTKCSVPDCTSTLKGGKGLCSKHYQRLKFRGSLDQPLQTGPSEVRFWSYVNIKGPIPDYAPQLGPCWLWTGKIEETSYGRVSHRGRLEGAHRFAYELVVGPIPPGLHLDHLCRVPPCVNPAHLEPVTVAVNNQRVPVTPERRKRLSENGKKGAAARWGARPTD